jgi:hypothetical protein
MILDSRDGTNVFGVIDSMLLEREKVQAGTPAC